jgi:hypothetical protein
MDRPRDQLFSGSGGPYQQDIGVVPGHLPSKIKHLQHRRAFSNNAMEFQVLQQLLFQLAHPPALVV